jgi:hypothetical protein
MTRRAIKPDWRSLCGQCRKHVECCRQPCWRSEYWRPRRRVPRGSIPPLAASRMQASNVEPTTTAIARGWTRGGTTRVTTARFHSSGTASIATPIGVSGARTANAIRIVRHSEGALKPVTAKRSIASIATADATGVRSSETRGRSLPIERPAGLNPSALLLRRRQPRADR